MSNSYYQLEPGGKCSGKLTIPGDKSISHRAVILASIANGISDVKGFLPSSDCKATLNAFQEMGVGVEDVSRSHIRIQGVGQFGLRPPSIGLNMGNSGTAIRLLAGILSGQTFATTLFGDESLNLRPMQRIQAPLQKMGANLMLSAGDVPPILIKPSDSLTGICYQLPIASAQVKSCILLAGLFAKGETCVIENIKTRDHTERMLKSFSYPVEIKSDRICLRGNQGLKACTVDVPGDISSAAFFIVGAIISKSSQLVIKNVGINPTRDGVIEILRLMGAKIQIQNIRNMGAEPVADLLISSSNLSGIEIPKKLVAKAIDEFPIIFIAAAYANGITKLCGAEELRNKESDRIHAMAVGLKQIGIDCTEKQDGVDILGGKIMGGEVDCLGDHRVAMAFAIASLVSERSITILNIKNVHTSFPNFVACSKKVGIKITEKATRP